MYTMGMGRNETKDFETIQDCIQAMRENGYLHRNVFFTEGLTIFSKKIQIDESGNVNIGRKKAEKSL